MRVALLVLTLAVRRSLGVWMLATPGEGVRCACIGLNDCSEMKNSDSCKSDPECDKGELGAIICSCKAARTAKAGGRRPM